MELRGLKKLLIVDDDADILTISQYALKEDKSLEVRVASSGEEALNIAKSFQPDLILLDIMMPKMDGITTLKHLRSRPETQKTPIAFFTAKVTEDEISSYVQYGVIDVLIKPFDPMKFSSSIQAIWCKYQKNKG